MLVTFLCATAHGHEHGSHGRLLPTGSPFDHRKHTSSRSQTPPRRAASPRVQTPSPTPAVGYLSPVTTPRVLPVGGTGQAREHKPDNATLASYARVSLSLCHVVSECSRFFLRGPGNHAASPLARQLPGQVAECCDGGSEHRSCRCAGALACKPVSQVGGQHQQVREEQCRRCHVCCHRPSSTPFLAPLELTSPFLVQSPRQVSPGVRDAAAEHPRPGASADCGGHSCVSFAG